MIANNPIFIPGPTNIPERLRLAMAKAAWDHRSPAFGEIISPIAKGLQQIFGDPGAHVAFFTGSGTTGWQSVLVNLLAPGQRVLAVRNGMFSERWIALAQDLGLVVDIIEAPWGQGAPIAELGDALAQDSAHQIAAVLAVHNETSTGVRSDIAAIRQALDGTKHPALLCVDGVSSIASMPFEMQEWGVDAAVAGSQKGFMLPTGLAIVALSDKARALAAANKGPKGCLNLEILFTALAAGSFPFTPAVSLVSGLAESIEMLLEEGLPQVHARHRHIAQGVRAAVTAWGLEPVAHSPELFSDTVTAIRVPPGYSGNAVVEHARNRYAMNFGIGLGPDGDRVFRIGHLGYLSEAMVLSGLAVAEMTLHDLNFSLTLGAGVAAAQRHFSDKTEA